MSAKLAVLITYYDEAELLTECVNSLLSGMQLPDEILIYDDCSPRPASDYAPQVEQLRILRGEENRGAVYGRNLLLNTCTSDYVHYHDADDLFEPAWCASIRRAIAEEQPDLIITNCARRGGEIQQARIFRFRQPFDVRATALVGHTNTLSITFTRELALRNGGYRAAGLTAALDYYFNNSLALLASRTVLIDEPLVIARPRLNSLARGQDRRLSPKHREANLKALALLAPHVPARYHDIMAEVAASVSSHLYEAGHYESARLGFAQARRYGRAQYRYRGILYRQAARVLGPLTTERLGLIYRSIIPANLRWRLFRLLRRG